MKQALITGSQGFIGSHLKKALEKEGVKVIEFSIELGQDLTKIEDFKKLQKADTVFHLAAVSGYRDARSGPLEAYRVNLLGTVNVLNYCRRAGAKILFPSTYVYDEPYKDYKKETDPVKPTTDYSHSKLLGGNLCRFYSRIYGVDSVIVRISNVYGAGQDMKYIVPIIVDHVKNGKPLKLTKPKVERSYVYIDDVVKAFIMLARAKTKPGEVFNLGPLKPTSLENLVKIVEKLLGKRAKVSYSGQSRPYEVSINRYNTEKIRKRIGWRAEVSLEDGLKRYINNIS